MDLVAGPQGSGKSTFFPVADRGHDAFNVDDRRRQLNRGSSRKIPPEVVAAELDDCINRVANRLERGGHGVSPSILRETYAASMRNLSRAVGEFDAIQVYDNARQARLDDPPDEVRPPLVLESQRGMITYVTRKSPRWLRGALAGSDHDLG